MSDKTHPPTPPVLGDDSISLNEALSDLEHIIDDQVNTDEVNEGDTPSGEQYTIPLLDDVLVPGMEVVDDFGESLAPIRRQLASVDDDESQAVIRRLTNEIEVIVQTGIEEALQNAVEVITERVQRHVDIILPEILDEIADIKARKNRI